jgi:hypothetical protein
MAALLALGTGGLAGMLIAFVAQSFAVDAESHSTSLRYLSQPDVFNVSITRARN